MKTFQFPLATVALAPLYHVTRQGDGKTLGIVTPDAKGQFSATAFIDSQRSTVATKASMESAARWITENTGFAPITLAKDETFVCNVKVAILERFENDLALVQVLGQNDTGRFAIVCLAEGRHRFYGNLIFNGAFKQPWKFQYYVGTSKQTKRFKSKTGGLNFMRGIAAQIIANPKAFRG